MQEEEEGARVEYNHGSDGPGQKDAPPGNQGWERTKCQPPPRPVPIRARQEGSGPKSGSAKPHCPPAEPQSPGLASHRRLQ